jgi:hypothetical protein
MPAEISPVKAPCASLWQAWAPSAIGMGSFSLMK